MQMGPNPPEILLGRKRDSHPPFLFWLTRRDVNKPGDFCTVPAEQCCACPMRIFLSNVGAAGKGGNPRRY